MSLADAYAGKTEDSSNQSGERGRSQRYMEGKRKLAAMAQGRQRFTNKEYARAESDMQAAKEQAAKDREKARRTGYSLVGTGAALGAKGGPKGMAIGAAAGLGVGMMGEIGSRMAEGDNFFEAAGKSFGRLPTATEVSASVTGAAPGLLGMAFSNQPSTNVTRQYAGDPASLRAGMPSVQQLDTRDAVPSAQDILDRKTLLDAYAPSAARYGVG